MNEMKNEKNDNCMSYLHTNKCASLVIQIVTNIWLSLRFTSSLNHIVIQGSEFISPEEEGLFWAGWLVFFSTRSSSPLFVWILPD